MPGADAETPYVDAILDYARRDPSRHHIPGHKGGQGADPALRALVGEQGLRHDVPALIEGIDVGPEPTPFGRAQELAAQAWGARRTWFLFNGASQGNQAACLALAHSGRRVIVQRNVHSSTIDGLVLAGLQPRFVAPELDPELGITHCPTPAAIEAALSEEPDAVGVIIVSPTYFGACAQVEEIAEAVHRRGLPLVVDEAWGAHLHFGPDLPIDAIAAGADLVISSTHKTVGSLTQAAMLHLGHGDQLDAAVVDRCVTLTETTSPSALLGGSLDAARRLAQTRGSELLAETVAELERAREEVKAIEGLDVLDQRLAGRRGVAAWDPLRLSIDCRATGATGYRLAAEMRAATDIHFELASLNVVVSVLGLAAPARPLVDRLLNGLRAVVPALSREVSGSRELEPFAPPPPWGPLELIPRDAFLAPQRSVPFEDAAGEIAAESLAAYPPGVPNVLPGERLTPETLDYIRETLAHGGSVRGASDRALHSIRVVTGSR